mmetsp:Transcript_14926/g.45624  ORF Transcript_14926/g.45624 Transcript_14926/m.45624 type:complete len:127 (+) Transcript_14926:1349-1729(+)
MRSLSWTRRNIHPSWTAWRVMSTPTHRSMRLANASINLSITCNAVAGPPLKASCAKAEANTAVGRYSHYYKKAETAYSTRYRLVHQHYGITTTLQHHWSLGGALLSACPTFNGTSMTMERMQATFL